MMDCAPGAFWFLAGLGLLLLPFALGAVGSLLSLARSVTALNNRVRRLEGRPTAYSKTKGEA